MSMIIGLTLVFINFIVGLAGKSNLALLMYITLSIVAPITNIFGTKISYEILGFFPIVVLFLMSRKKIIMHKTCNYLMGYLFVFIISTLISNLLYNPQNEVLAVFGVFRMVSLFIIFVNDINNLEILKKSLTISLFVNLLAMILQLTLPNAVEIFNALYVKESATAISWFLSVGRFTRLTGTFSNTAPSGYFFLLVFAIHLVEYAKTRSKYNATILIISLICGIATVSKTFYVGLPILLVINSLLHVIMKNKEKNYIKGFDLKKPIIIITAILGMILFLNLTSDKLYTSYYINNLDFSSIFSSRYDVQSGNLSDAISVIKSNWLIGVGSTRISNEFVGDSLYVSLLHGTGIVGFSIVSILIISLILNNIKKANRQNLLLLVCILMVGFAIPTLFSMLGIIILAYIEINQRNTK